MKDVLKYKGFIGSVHFNAEDKTFYGKIEGINDLVTFEGNTVEKLERALHEAVEDYVVLCKEVKKEPLKSCKGSFNVRISPEIHRKAVEKATFLGMSLNQFVQNSVEHEISARGPDVACRTGRGGEGPIIDDVRASEMPKTKRKLDRIRKLLI